MASLGLGLSTLLAGCFEMEVEVSISADGSGRQELRIGMTELATATLRQSAVALNAAGDRADPMEIYQRSKAEKLLADQGLVLSEYRTYRERRRDFVEITADFKAASQLNGAGVLGAEAEWYMLPGRNHGGIRLLFFPRGHEAWMAGVEQAKKAPSGLEMGEIERQYFMRQKERMAGFIVKLKLQLPGAVDYCSSNLTHTGERTVEMQVSARDIDTPADLIKALAPRFEVEFDGSGCDMVLDKIEPKIERPGRD